MSAAAVHHTSTGLDTRKIAFWTFIGSECLLFGTLIATYLVYEGRSISGPTTHEILNIPLTSVSTFVLLFSSLAMVLGLAGVQEGNKVKARLWIGMTAFMVSRHVRIPLAVRAILPALTNQYIWLMKATTLGIAIGYPDYFMIVSTSINQSGQTIELIALLMAGFLLINYALGFTMNLINKRLALKGQAS